MPAVLTVLSLQFYENAHFETVLIYLHPMQIEFLPMKVYGIVLEIEDFMSLRFCVFLNQNFQLSTEIYLWNSPNFENPLKIVMIAVFHILPKKKHG